MERKARRRPVTSVLTNKIPYFQTTSPFTDRISNKYLSHGQGYRREHVDRVIPPIPSISNDDRTPWFFVPIHRHLTGDSPSDPPTTDHGTMVEEVLPERPVPGPLYAQPPSLFYFTFCILLHLITGRPQLQKAVKKAWKDLSKKDKKGFKSTPLSQIVTKINDFFYTMGWMAGVAEEARAAQVLRYDHILSPLKSMTNRHESYRFKTQQDTTTDRNKKKKN